MVLDATRCRADLLVYMLHPRSPPRARHRAVFEDSLAIPDLVRVFNGSWRRHYVSSQTRAINWGDVSGCFGASTDCTSLAYTTSPQKVQSVRNVFDIISSYLKKYKVLMLMVVIFVQSYSEYSMQHQHREPSIEDGRCL